MITINTFIPVFSVGIDKGLEHDDHDENYDDADDDNDNEYCVDNDL